MHADDIQNQPTPQGGLPQGAPPELETVIAKAARDALDKHGPTAFNAPMEAAVAHEAGHAVVATHEGLVIKSVSLLSRQDVWTGWCACPSVAWKTGPDTTAASDLSAARTIIAGLAGETICRLDRPGSSLDELALSQLVGLNAATKIADPALSGPAYETFAQKLWHDQVWDATLAILFANSEPFERLAALLQERKRIGGRKLRNVLAQIKRVPA